MRPSRPASSHFIVAANRRRLPERTGPIRARLAARSEHARTHETRSAASQTSSSSAAVALALARACMRVCVCGRLSAVSSSRANDHARLVLAAPGTDAFTHAHCTLAFVSCVVRNYRRRRRVRATRECQLHLTRRRRCRHLVTTILEHLDDRVTVTERRTSSV